MRLIILTIITFLLLSCGMTGPLYLPAKSHSHTERTHRTTTE